MLGKKSGGHSIEWKLKSLGISATPEQVDTVLKKVKSLAESKKGLVSDEEFGSIVEQLGLK